ncbi:hypothetical protein B0T14DRAFT_508288 [Immersiella caudata]|uniref:Uncharacterized protein n=1 Tax=Immersiella caudata TaxID=314043 RepID=A0AA39XIQ4_9PEZI|nr:hypothetical protein B0T14DRAFT_508288 [Immersiella caudata]
MERNNGEGSQDHGIGEELSCWSADSFADTLASFTNTAEFASIDGFANIGDLAEIDQLVNINEAYQALQVGDLLSGDQNPAWPGDFGGPSGGFGGRSADTPMYDNDPHLQLSTVVEGRPNATGGFPAPFHTSVSHPGEPSEGITSPVPMAYSPQAGTLSTPTQASSTQPGQQHGIDCENDMIVQLAQKGYKYPEVSKRLERELNVKISPNAIGKRYHKLLKNKPTLLTTAIQNKILDILSIVEPEVAREFTSNSTDSSRSYTVEELREAQALMAALRTKLPEWIHGEMLRRERRAAQTQVQTPSRTAP